MKALLDLNILLDFFQQRDFYSEAAILLDLNKNKDVKGYLCAHEISNLTYFLEKEGSLKRKTANLVRLLLDEFNIIPIDKKLLKLAANNYHKDFEDDILAQAAEKHNLDFIVTRDVKGFRNSNIPALNPAQFLEMVLYKED